MIDHHLFALPKAEDLRETSGRSRTSDLDGLEDSRVIEALEEYLSEREAGRPLNRVKFLADHATIADVLRACA